MPRKQIGRDPVRDCYTEKREPIAMKLTDLIYAKTGFTFDLPNLTADLDAQNLVASLITLVAKSDGGISPDETVRMVEMLRQRFPLQPGEALDLITRAADELSSDSHLDEILAAINDKLALPHKEELMLMVLHVISADSEKDAGEMKLLAALIEGLKIPDKVMSDVYQRYFAKRKRQV
jgi:uncharacterized tellurite resistance protein B-like protein